MWDAGMMNDRMLILEADQFISSLRRDQYYLHSPAFYFLYFSEHQSIVHNAGRLSSQTVEFRAS